MRQFCDISRASSLAGLARLQMSILEDDDAVEAVGEVEIVGRDQPGETAVADEVKERGEHALAGRVIEIAGRLVAEQDLGVVGERADDCDPLLLAAGKPRRPVPGARREADLGQQPPRLFPRPPAREPGDHLR